MGWWKFFNFGRKEEPQKLPVIDSQKVMADAPQQLASPEPLEERVLELDGKDDESTVDVEYVLKRMVWSDKAIMTFNSKENGVSTDVHTPVLILPLEHDGERIVGRVYDKELERLVEFPIGFLQRYNLKKRYFELDMDASLIEKDAPDSGKIYLPFKTTDIKVETGINKDGKFIPKEGAPFKVYTVDGALQELPLILAFRSDEGVSIRGVEKSNGKPNLFLSHGSDLKKAVKDVLDELECGEYEAPKWDDCLVQMTRSIIPAEENKPEEKKAEEEPPKRVPLEVALGATSTINWENPQKIKAYLDEYVVGQHDAKIRVSVDFSGYMIKVRTKNKGMPKKNILLIGPTGSGKSFMMELLAARAALPFHLVQLVGKAEVGYRGENVFKLVAELKEKTKESAPYGVVFFDEFDKIVKNHGNKSHSYGPGIQKELIGFLKGGLVEDGMSTENLMFVAAGAFHEGGEEDSLEAIIRKRLSKKAGDFDEQEYAPLLAHVKIDDLIEYGMKPELAGRFDTICVLSQLSREAKLKILKEAKGSLLEQYRELFKEKGFNLTWKDEVYELIVDEAPDELGARGLSQVCSDLFAPLLFKPEKYASGKEITVDRAYATKALWLRGLESTPE